MKHRKLTQHELFELARRIFGDNPLDFAFQCPNCGAIAKIADWPEGLRDRAGQECVGRHMEAFREAGKQPRGCDYAAFGLFRGPWEIVMEKDGHSAWSFPLAGAPDPEETPAPAADPEEIRA